MPVVLAQARRRLGQVEGAVRRRDREGGGGTAPATSAVAPMTAGPLTATAAPLAVGRLNGGDGGVLGLLRNSIDRPVLLVAVKCPLAVRLCCQLDRIPLGVIEVAAEFLGQPLQKEKNDKNGFSPLPWGRPPACGREAQTASCCPAAPS